MSGVRLLRKLWQLTETASRFALTPDTILGDAAEALEEFPDLSELDSPGAFLGAVSNPEILDKFLSVLKTSSSMEDLLPASAESSAGQELLEVAATLRELAEKLTTPALERLQACLSDKEPSDTLQGSCLRSLCALASVAQASLSWQQCSIAVLL